MERLTQLVPANLKFARELNGMTITELSEKTSVSKQSISNWENGNRSPDFGTIKRLANILNVPYLLLVSAAREGASTENLALFRSRVAVPKRSKIAFEHVLEIYGDLVTRLSSIVNLPEFRLNKLLTDYKSFRVIENHEIEKKASEMRDFFNLSNGPILNMTTILERSGINVVFINRPGLGINALTKQYKGKFLILLNIADQSAVKIRFSLAHELGHILLHSEYDRKLYAKKEIGKRLEVEANMFASCFLMPASGFLLDVTRTTLGELVRLKKHWKVSVQSMAVRLTQLGIIDSGHEVQIFKEISRKYSRKDEPFDRGIGKIEIEYPSMLNAAIRFLNDEHRSNEVLFELRKDGLESKFLHGLFPYISFPEQNVEPYMPKLRLLK
ncbi:helix-turn-helix domain-containing protein [Lactiplantibacillus pentosus]|uniref:XRE family transcriptional regulator n=1 Tax=Lactiplantibacillus pentosus TaxID=1589 RepID=A0AAX6LGU8_LACPE|nr:XRE family transcriptional regulator [Lactiplantibacillus pentosus]MDF2313766.1 XRE family transcriptional regulator [Lactiplantibacillus pentosus]